MLTNSTHTQTLSRDVLAIRRAAPAAVLAGGAANETHARVPRGQPGSLSRRFARERRDSFSAAGGWRFRTW